MGNGSFVVLERKIHEHSVVFTAEEWADIWLTIAEGFIVGVCVSQYGAQLAGFTGAMSELFLSGWSIVATTSAAMGIIIGRKFASKKAGKAILPVLVASMLLLSTISAVCGALKLVMWGSDLITTATFVFSGITSGLMIGAMAGDNQTTARTALFRRASLGHPRAIAQCLAFAFVAYVSATTFSVIEAISKTNQGLVQAVLIEIAVGSVLAALCAVISVTTYIATWPQEVLPETPATGRRFLAVIVAESIIILGCAGGMYLTSDLTKGRAAVQNSLELHEMHVSSGARSLKFQ